MDTQQYRKKPVVIEAVLLTQENRLEVQKWCGGSEKIAAVDKDVGIEKGVRIQTLEGPLLARYGDYVIKGIKGEFYPCKPDIFEATYTPLGDQDGDQDQFMNLFRPSGQAALELPVLVSEPTFNAIYEVWLESRVLSEPLAFWFPTLNTAEIERIRLMLDNAKERELQLG